MASSSAFPSLIQLKIRLLGISPMVWRRVSAAVSLRSPDYLAQTARTCIYGHLEAHHVNDPAVSYLEMDDNVPGREHERGRPRQPLRPF